MPITRYTEGSVTVTLDGGLEAFVRQALETVAGETVRVMERAAQEVADQAKAEWYAPGSGVTERTGKSGDVQVVTTISPDEVRVSVGSTDLDRAKYIHRPGPLATVAKEIDAATYYAIKRAGGGRAKTVFHAKTTSKVDGVEAGKFYEKAISPRASDGRYLLAELIRKPMTLKVRAITPELGRAIAARAGR